MNASETAGMTTDAVTSRDGPRTGYPPPGPDAPGARAAARRHLLTLTGVTGIAFTLSWIAGLAVAAPSPKLTASGAEIIAALAGHGTAVATQFALTEGLPAAGLAIVSVALARAALRSGAAVAARFACIAGVAAAVISLAQFALGMALASASAPGPAHLLYAAVNRLDGAKMLALAALGLAGAASRVLPRWLRYTGIALAIAITASGVAYLLLLQGLAILAVPAGVLLLAFITGTGLTLGASASKPRRDRPSRKRGFQGSPASVPDAFQSRRSSPNPRPGTTTMMIRRIARQLSVPTTLLATACVAAGTVTGLFIYLDRSPIRRKYLPGSSAYWQQAAIAGVALLLYGYSWWRHQRRSGHQPGRLLLLAPLGKPAARRFARTMHQAIRSPSGFARAVATLPFAALLIYCPWRIGEQITAGLDPNWTVNAWGGPSYLGAMACHYLDMGLLIAAAAWLLGKILLPDAASTAHRGTPVPQHADFPPAADR